MDSNLLVSSLRPRARNHLAKPSPVRLSTPPPPPISRPRKTSAEIVSEAKASIVNAGARLVSTRRPCTPREPRRQLYGKIAPPGRPPSAVNLRYLQFEALGSSRSNLLDPIKPINQNNLNDKRAISARNLETINDKNEPVPPVRRLPALHNPPRSAQVPERRGVMEILNTKVESFNPRSNIFQTKPLGINKFNSSNIINNNLGRSFEKQNTVTEEDENYLQIENGDLKHQIPILKISKISEKPNRELEFMKIDNLVEIVKSHSGVKAKSENDGYIVDVLNELYNRIKTGLGSKGTLLGALYGLVESPTPEILLGVARIVLAMEVTGSNLTGACKLIYKVARSEHNDDLFEKSDIPELLIDGLARASPIDEPEACIYGYGAMRFLTQPPSSVAQGQGDEEPPAGPLAIRLLHRGAAQLMVLHLQMLNEASSPNGLRGSPLHALFQLSGAFRVLAGLGAALDTNGVFQENNGPIRGDSLQAQWRTVEGATIHLVKAAEICQSDVDVLGNICRTLSVLSELETCCDSLQNSTVRLGHMLEHLSAQKKSQGGLVRLGYTIGNVMAHCDSARLQFYKDPRAMSSLMEILQQYSEQDILQNENGENTADVLVKVVRIVANMSVNCEVGQGLGSGSLVSALLHILLVTSRVVSQDKSVSAELLLATLGALHNLSFYHNIGQDFNISQPSQRWDDITQVLCNVLTLGPPFTSEAARVLGNLTRCQHSRGVVVRYGGLKALLLCLDNDDPECLRTAVGVVVNLLGDWECRPLFREQNGHLKLLAVLRTAPPDWVLSSLICQALWNYLIDALNIIATLGDSNTRELAGILADCLDEDAVAEMGGPNYEDFCNVASDLLDKLEQFFNSLESDNTSPCGSPSDDDDDIYFAGKVFENDKFKSWLQD